MTDYMMDINVILDRSMKSKKRSKQTLANATLSRGQEILRYSRFRVSPHTQLPGLKLRNAHGNDGPLPLPNYCSPALPPFLFILLSHCAGPAQSEAGEQCRRPHRASCSECDRPMFSKTETLVPCSGSCLSLPLRQGYLSSSCGADSNVFVRRRLSMSSSMVIATYILRIHFESCTYTWDSVVEELSVLWVRPY